MVAWKKNVLTFDFLTRFSGANRCLRFDYAIADNNIGGTYTTRLTVRVYSDAAPSTNEFITNTGNEWVTAEIDLPAVNNMKVG